MGTDGCGVGQSPRRSSAGRYTNEGICQVLIPLSPYFYAVVGVFCFYLFSALLCVFGVGATVLLDLDHFDITQISAFPPDQLKARYLTNAVIGAIGTALAIALWFWGKRRLRSHDRFLYLSDFWWNVLPWSGYSAGALGAALILWVSYK